MNEVNIMNIGGIDHEIDDQRARDVIAHSENGLDPQSNLPISSRHYNVGDYVIGQDRLYYEVTAEINIGDVMAVGTNLRATIVSEELVRLKNQSALAVIQTIAYCETGALSTKSYSVGDYMYWDYGLDAGLYEVISPIIINDAFAINTNIKATDTITTMVKDIDTEVSCILNVLGSKNLCPNNAKSQVINGVSFTVNSDGSITANGTATSLAVFNIEDYSGYKLNKNKAHNILSGCTGGSTDTYYMYIDCSVNGSSYTRSIILTDGEIVIDEYIYYSSLSIAIKTGVTVSNVRFYPMIRPASIKDNRYVPYVMPNKDLMKINDVTNVVPTKTSIVNSFNFVKSGHVVSFYANVRPTRAVFNELFTNAPKIATGEMYIQGISSGGAVLKSWCGIYNTGLVRVYVNDAEVNTTMLFSGTYITSE